MRVHLLAIAIAALSGPQVANACSLIPFAKEPTVAQRIAGLDLIFGGTVVGYVTEDGEQLMGSMPTQCLNEQGNYQWFSMTNEPLVPECKRYLDTVAALFRVDTSIVGPAVGEIASYDMTWGDGDCDNDFEIGEEWLIAGFYFTQELTEAIRPDEVAELRRLAARPKFDMQTLF